MKVLLALVLTMSFSAMAEVTVQGGLKGIIKCRDNLKDIRRRNRQLAKENKVLSGRLTRMTDRNQSLTSENNDLLSQVTRLRERTKKLRNKKHNLEADLAACRNSRGSVVELERLRAENDRLIHENDRQLRELRRKDRKIARLEQEIDDLIGGGGHQPIRTGYYCMAGCAKSDRTNMNMSYSTGAFGSSQLEAEINATDTVKNKWTCSYGAVVGSCEETFEEPDVHYCRAACARSDRKSANLNFAKGAVGDSLLEAKVNALKEMRKAYTCSYGLVVDRCERR